MNYVKPVLTRKSTYTGEQIPLPSRFGTEQHLVTSFRLVSKFIRMDEVPLTSSMFQILPLQEVDLRLGRGRLYLLPSAWTRLGSARVSLPRLRRRNHRTRAEAAEEAVRSQRHRRPRRPYPAAHRQRGPQPILRFPGDEGCKILSCLSNLNSSFVALDRIRHTVVR